MTPQEHIVRLTAMLQTATQQRDQQANRCLTLEADFAVAREIIKARDAKISELLAKHAQEPDVPEVPKAASQDENVTKLR